MKKSRILWTVLSLVIFLVLVFLLFSCSSSEQKDPPLEQEEQGIHIGFAFDSFVVDRWLRDRDMFVYVAQQLGATVDVQNANGDVARQSQQIYDFVTRGVDVIVIVAVDCFSLDEAVSHARREGIPVIAYDRLIQSVPVDLFVSVDNELIGREMAQVLNDKMPEGGHVVMINGPVTDSNTRHVRHGFESALRRSIILDRISVESWGGEYGRAAIIDLLNRFPNIDAVMCGNDILAGQVIQVLSERQLAGKIFVTGQDADLDACQRIVEGTQTMTVFKPIEALASRAAEFAVRLARGEELEEVTDFMRSDVADIPYYGLKPVTVTRENIERVIIESGFHLREDVFRNVRE